jgi:DNA-binding LacI/PurR family transcriptional regulator
MDDWRLKGFTDQCNVYRLEPVVVSGCRTEDELSAKVIDLLASGYVPDGIFGRNDPIALVGMQACQKMGFNVPDDISVIGFDNTRLCRFSSPTLSSVEIEQSEIARWVMDMMMSLIDNRSSFEKRLEVYLDTKLVMRESV